MGRETDERRVTVDLLDREFGALLESLVTLVESVPRGLLYRRPPHVTVGESILRSAAVLERVFGGLTTNLWDDPFEWTLAENLSNSEKIVDYLKEVMDARQRMFVNLEDEALVKFVSDPAGEQRTVVSLLLEALVGASDYRGRAIATLKLLSDVSAPEVII